MGNIGKSERVRYAARARKLSSDGTDENNEISMLEFILEVDFNDTRNFSTLEHVRRKTLARRSSIPGNC